MKPEKNSAIQNMTRTLVAGGVGLGTVLLLLLLFSALLLQGLLPPSWVAICPYLALGIGALGCGIASARCPKRLYGALGGGLLMAVCLGLIGLLFRQTAFSPLYGGIALLLCLLPAAMGSIVTTLFR